MKKKDAKILFIAAHPYLQKSRANKAVVEAVSSLDGVTVHRLYDLYPYFHIDIQKEKDLLLQHNAIVIQHPFYWYSMPALLKLWLDEVLESGWAYGPDGNKLHDKDFLLSITIGGPEDSYRPENYNRFPVSALLAPWDQTVNLCQMNWHEPSLLYGAIRANDQELIEHAVRVRARLTAYLRDGAFS